MAAKEKNMKAITIRIPISASFPDDPVKVSVGAINNAISEGYRVINITNYELMDSGEKGLIVTLEKSTVPYDPIYLK